MDEQRIEFCPTCGQPDNCGDCNHTPVPHQEYFACDPCECGGHPDCPVCGVEAIVREREARDKLLERLLDYQNMGYQEHLARRAAFETFKEDEAAHERMTGQHATDDEIDNSFDAYR